MSEIVDGMKQCGPKHQDGCKRWLSLSDFGVPHGVTKSGRIKYPNLCRKCRQAQRRAQRLARLADEANRSPVAQPNMLLYPDTRRMRPAKPINEIAASPAMRAMFGF
jgi:hypothetical protein